MEKLKIWGNQSVYYDTYTERVFEEHWKPQLYPWLAFFPFVCLFYYTRQALSLFCMPG